MVRVMLKGLKKYFGRMKAVDDINMEIKPGEFLALLGPSGCGKTTLLRCMSGLERVTAGKVFFDDDDVTYLSPKDRNISMVFQNYAVWPHMTVESNIAYPLRVKKYSRNEIRKRIIWAAKLLRIGELLNRYPVQLSGGQRQRVAVARAIVIEPRVLLMDEPLSNLDALLRVRMRSEVKKLQQNLGVTTIYVTHDQVEAMTMGDRIAVLEQGKLQQLGTSDEIYHNPSNMFVAGFIGSPQMNFIEVEITSRNQGLYLRTKGLVIPLLDKFKAKVSELSGRRNYLLGIRPEHIYVAGQAQIGKTATTKGKVYFLELLRSDTVIHLEKEFGFLVVKAPGDLKVEEDKELEVLLDLNRIHLFYKDTGEAIL